MKTCKNRPALATRKVLESALLIGVSLVLNVTNNRRATMSEYELPAGSTMRKRRRKRASIFVNMTQRDSVRNIRKRRNQRKQQSA